MSDHTVLARNAIRELSLFAGIDLETVPITRLGGLTNLVFRVDVGDGRFQHDIDGHSACVRIAGEGTHEYIDRRIEAQAARAAAQAGVSPHVFHFDEDSGLMIAEFIDGATTMTPALFKSIAGAPARAGQAFHKLHNSGQTFNFRFELFNMIDEYLDILANKDVAFPPGYHEVLREAESVREALDANPATTAPCHCDPLCENFLDTGAHMWIVDWEYSGMNDPMWDLGDLSVEGEFTPEQDEQMINAYFKGRPGDVEYGRIVIYKAMCDLLWTLWGLIQHANNNPADDFWAYSVNRFERCKALMNTPDFSGHVRIIANNGTGRTYSRSSSI